MAAPFVIPQNAQQPIDPRTGSFNRPWYLFFQAVFDRIGGAGGTGNAALDIALEDIRVQLAVDSDATAAVSTLGQRLTTYQATQAATDAAQDVRLSDLETLGAFAR